MRTIKELFLLAAEQIEEMKIEDLPSDGLTVILRGSRMRLEIQHSSVSRTLRQAMKRHFKLEVKGDPTWRYLHGFDPVSDTFGVEVDIFGAYACKPTGELEQDADDASLKKAQLLDELTPEQALYLMKLEAAKLRQPKKVTTYTCEPAEEVSF